MKTRDALVISSCLFGLTSCTDFSPANEMESLVSLLIKGPSRLQCFVPPKEHDQREAASPTYKSYTDCDLLASPLRISAHDDRVIATTRCSKAEAMGEFKITVYSNPQSSEYFGGYYCSFSARADLPKMQLGEATISPDVP